MVQHLASGRNEGAAHQLRRVVDRLSASDGWPGGDRGGEDEGGDGCSDGLAHWLLLVRRRWGRPDPPLRGFALRPVSPPDRTEPAPRDRRELREPRSEEHTSELQSLMRISYAVFCLNKKK